MVMLLSSVQIINERKAEIDSRAPSLASLLLPVSVPDPSTGHMPRLLQKMQKKPSCVSYSYPGLCLQPTALSSFYFFCLPKVCSRQMAILCSV